MTTPTTTTAALSLGLRLSAASRVSRKDWHAVVGDALAGRDGGLMVDLLTVESRCFHAARVRRQSAAIAAVPCVADRFSLCTCAKCCAARAPKKTTRKEALAALRSMGAKGDAGWRAYAIEHRIGYAAALAAYNEGAGRAVVS